MVLGVGSDQKELYPVDSNAIQHFSNLDYLLDSKIMIDHLCIDFSPVF